jgi:hypothetical protein
MKVSWEYDSQDMKKHVPNHQPDNDYSWGVWNNKLHRPGCDGKFARVFTRTVPITQTSPPAMEH